MRSRVHGGWPKSALAQSQHSDVGLQVRLRGGQQRPDEPRVRRVAAQRLHVLLCRQPCVLAAPTQHALEVDMADVAVRCLGGVEAQQALVRRGGGHPPTVREVERAAIIRVAPQGRQGEPGAHGRGAVLPKWKLLQCLVNARAENVPVVGREATHHVERVRVEGSRRLVGQNGLAQVPQLAGVVEGSRGEEVGRAVREAQDVNEALMEAPKRARSPARHDVV
mmetsp:Transcript_93319/g.260937  ORF Transcript_93319/g.260937 Transcript_93319/m.260937 type:complete len:222 (-) Transcript_93319:2347-3012(-)